MLNFYGADGAGDSLDDGDGSGDGGDKSMDIDHEGFDPAAYVLRAVRDDALTELLQADEALVSEVQELNNDMQNLVYENYNKFVDATDTIRKMKDQVEGMESEIELLIQTMDSVDTRTREINARLQPKRSKIENMVSLQRLIKRLEFLFELPMRLKRSPISRRSRRLSSTSTWRLGSLRSTPTSHPLVLSRPSRRRSCLP